MSAGAAETVAVAAAAVPGVGGAGAERGQGGTAFVWEKVRVMFLSSCCPQAFASEGAAVAVVAAGAVLTANSVSYFAVNCYS